MNENENFSQEEYVYEEVGVVQTDGESSPKKWSFLIEKITSLILLGLAFLLPLFIFPLSGISVGFGKSMLLTVGVITAAVLCVSLWIYRGEIQIPRNHLFVILGTLGVWYAVSSYLSASFSQSFFGNGEAGTGLLIVSFVLLAFLSSIYFYKEERTLSAILLVTLSGAIVFVFQALHILFPSGLFTLGGLLSVKTQNLIGNWSDLGIFSGLIVVLSLVALETLVIDQKKYRRFFIGLLCAALVFHVLAAYNMAWPVLAVVSALIALCSGAFSKRGENRFPLSPSIIVAAISVVFIFAGPAINSKLFSIMNMEPNIEIRPSWSGTLTVARGSMTSDLKTAIIGDGPNRFFTQWGKYHPTEVNLTQWWNVDFNSGISLLPESISTVGFIGFLLWIVFFVLFLLLGFRALREKLPSLGNLSKFFLLSSFFATLFLFAVLCLNTPGVVITGLAFLFLGIFIAVLSQIEIFSATSLRYAESKYRYAVFAGLFVLLGALLTLGYYVIQNDRAVFAYRLAVMANMPGEYDKAETQMFRAISLAKNDAYYRSYSILSAYRANQVLARTDLTPDNIRLEWNTMFRAAIENAKNAAIVDRGNYMNWVLLGNTYAALVPLKITGVSDDAFNSAKASYEKAATLNPRNPGIPLALANLSAAAGKQDEALKYAEEAVKLKTNYTDALALISQIQVNSGHADKAIPALVAAIASDQPNPTLLFQLGFVYFKNADYEKAAAALEQAISLVPNYANAKYFLGLTYSKLGRVKDAIKQMEEVQATNPERTDITTILTNLRAGNPPFATIAAETKATANAAPQAPKGQ